MRRPRANPTRSAGRQTAARIPRLTAADLAASLAQIAPPQYAAEWDNVGLLAGNPEWPVRRALLAIDLTDAVAREALAGRAQGLILYHPPIFKGIRSITPGAECPTALLPDLLAARVSLFALHTALDAAPGGTNDVLLDCFPIASRRPLESAVSDNQQCKLVVFVPAASVERLRTALASAGAGVIGHYRECSFELAGQGTFCGDDSTSPAVGQKLRLERVDEIRLEMVAPRTRLDEIVRALYAAHPYEEPAFDLYPTRTLVGRGMVGMGRVGVLKRPMRGAALLARLRGCVDLSEALVVGDLRRSFHSITAAAGSFGVRSFRDRESLVLTGEFKHHDALELLRRGVTAVHLGHYASERPALERVRQELAHRLPMLEIRAARGDRSPFVAVRGVAAHS